MSATVETSIKERICSSIEIPVLTRCCFCCPLRKGLIVCAYLNLTLTVVVTVFLSMYISFLRQSQTPDEYELPKVIADVIGLCLELIMTPVFIYGLHIKNAMLLKVYLYFEIVFSAIGFIYSLAFMTKETGSELFLILFQLMLQIYLSILIYSSIVKMQRDGTVKYTRETDPA